MTSRTYDTIQGLLSYAVLFSGAIALAFTLEYNNLIFENDITPWGRQNLPIIFNTAWAIFAVAIVAKVWGFWIENKFWLKGDIADKLHAFADKIDPRRKG